MTIKRAALCLLVIPMLAACGDEPATAPVVAEDSRDAEGDVLPGSITDDMVPLDRLTSTSPAARETAEAGEGSDAGTPVSGDSAAAQSVSSAEPAGPAPAQESADDTAPADTE